MTFWAMLPKTKPPARFDRTGGFFFCCLLPSAYCLLLLRSRREDSLQRDVKIEGEIRHHVVVRLISTRGRQGLIRHENEIRRCCVRVALAGLRECISDRNACFTGELDRSSQNTVRV